MSPKARFGEGLTGFVGRQVGVTRGQVCRTERVLAVRGGEGDSVGGELIIMFALYINPPR